MVMNFILHPLSQYNSITEPCARFLLSLFEYLTIDFPSHFILSIIDVFRDTATCDKLIFASAITWILCNFSVICATDITTVKRSEAQFRSRQSDSATPPSHSSSSLLRGMCHSGTSWCSYSSWMLTLIHSLQSCIR